MSLFEVRLTKKISDFPVSDLLSGELCGSAVVPHERDREKKKIIILIIKYYFIYFN